MVGSVEWSTIGVGLPGALRSPLPPITRKLGKSALSTDSTSVGGRDAKQDVLELMAQDVEVANDDPAEGESCCPHDGMDGYG